MNRRYHILTLLLLFFTVSGCTLMLEEAETKNSTETTTNGDGFTAPRTVTTEFGTVSYQFNDGVRVIDEKYMPYLVSCRMDTAAKRTEIYFTKNIPSDLLPQRGEYLGTTMAEMFDYTLSDEVDAVTSTDLGILVASHPVSLNKVFKELDFKLSANIASEETEDSAVSRSAASPSTRLVLKPIAPKTRVMSEAERKLFSILVIIQNDGKDYDFRLGNAYKYKESFAIGNMLLPKTKIGMEGSGKVYHAIGMESVQKLDVDFSLSNGLEIDLDNQIHSTYCISSETQKGYFAFPITGSTGMTVPKDRILRQYEWKALDYLLPFHSALGVSVNVEVVKIGISFNFGVAYDTSFDIKCEKPFVYEQEESSTLFEWSLKTSKDFETTIERLKEKKVKDPASYQNIGAEYFKWGSRMFFHFELGLTVGVGTPAYNLFEGGVSLFNLNGDASMTHVINNDYNSTKPSTLKKNGITLYATDKSSDTRRLTWTESKSAAGKSIGGVLPKIAEYLDWLTLAAYTISSEPKSFTLWQSTDEAFPSMELKLNYNKNSSGDTVANYSATLEAVKPSFSFLDQNALNTQWNRNFRDIQLLIFDEEYNYIKSAQTSDPKYPDYTDYYPYLSSGRSYPFEFSLSSKETEDDKFFYLVPAYVYGYTQERAGMTPLFVPVNNFFTRPYKYNTRFNRGVISKIQPLWVENDDKYCKQGYCLDGIAVDAECVFNKWNVSYVYLRVEFYDTDGRILMGKDFEYTLGKNNSGTIKAIYLINHRIETVVGEAKLTLYCKDPTKQSSLDAEYQKIVLDEQEFTFDDDTESWPVYDYTNTSDWSAKGYKLAY